MCAHEAYLSFYPFQDIIKTSRASGIESIYNLQGWIAHMQYEGKGKTIWLNYGGEKENNRIKNEMILLYIGQNDNHQI